MKRRILAILLAAIMVLSAVPFSVFAEEATETVLCPGKGEIHTADNCESEWFADVAPVCNKPGYSVYTCLGCGDQYIVVTKEASNTPHTIVKATKEATCTETGIKEDRWQCTACKDYFTDANGENVTTDYETPALGHDHQAVEGDCTIVKCSRCGHTQQAETNGTHDGAHNYKVIKFHTPAATCKDTAKADVECTVCHHRKYNVDVASDVPHDFKDAVTAKDPTCTERGYKAHKQCKVCNRYFTPDGRTELYANPTTDAQRRNALYIDADGHDLDHRDTIKISVTYPKCDIDGYATYECGACHQKVEGEKIPATPSYFFYIKIKSNGNFVMNSDNETKKVFVTAAVNAGDVVAGSEYDFITTDGTPATHERVYITEEDGSKKVNHKFNFAADEVTAPTCTEYGYTKRLCLDCGKQVSSERKDPTGHTSYVYGSKAFKDALEDGDIVITKAPTCSKGGLYTYDCKNCDETGLIGYIAPLGHETAKTVTTANCTAAGVTFTYAPVKNGVNGDCDCDKYTLMTTYQFLKPDGSADGDPWTLWDPSTISIDPVDGDLYIPEVEDLDPNNAKDTAGFLVPNSSTITKAAKNSTHIKRTQVVNAPTCDTKGSGVELCIFCGDNESYEIPANGHKFKLDWAAGTAAKNKTLKNSLEYKAAIADGFVADENNAGVIEATCTVGSYLSIKCENCSALSGETDKDITNVSFKLSNKLGHDVRTETVYPTCDGTIAVGYTYTYCDRGCWNYYDDTEENREHWTNLTTYQEKTSYTEDEVLGYHPNLFDVDASTGEFLYFVEVYKTGDCTKVGLDKFACPDCDRNILVIQGETGSHLKPSIYERNNTNYRAQQNATCCVDGSTEWFVCQRCGDEVGGTPITKECKYVLVIAGKAPSCNANGTVTYGYKAIYTCNEDNCCNHTNKTLNQQKFFEYKVVGTDENGEDVYGFVQLAGITRSMVYEKSGNTWTNNLKNSNVLANMALNKVDTTIRNNRTSNVFAADNVRLDVEHQFENKDGKPANCTENGYTAYQLCTECGYVSGKRTLYAPEHDYDAKEDYAADCLKYGYSVQTCKICNYVYVTNFVAPLGHDLEGAVETTVDATCTQPGYKYKTCQRAGCVEPRVLTSAITYVPHKNAAGKELGIVDKAAFEDEIKTGVEVKNSITTICTAGMSEEDRTCACGWVAAAEHHVEQTTVVAPTCTTDGYTVVTCVTCKAVLSTTVVNNSKTGHTWDSGVVIEEATEVSGGTILYTCTTCGETYTGNIPVDATVYLDLTYANANGKEGFAESSLITVKVVLSSLKASIRTLNYDLDYDQSKLEFVSATGTNLFAIASINDVKDDAGNSTGIVKFAGLNPNAIEVSDAVEIATITFRAKGDANQTDAVEAAFNFVAAEAYLNTGDKVSVNTVLEDNSIEIVKLMNVYTGTESNPDTAIDMQDALAIYDIIQAKGYNVAADLDKNGAVDAYDLQLFYNFFVGAMKAADIFAAN